MMIEVGIRGMDGEQSWILERLFIVALSVPLPTTHKEKKKEKKN